MKKQKNIFFIVSMVVVVFLNYIQSVPLNIDEELNSITDQYLLDDINTESSLASVSSLLSNKNTIGINYLQFNYCNFI
jgi:hypothetical protein